LWGFGRLVSFGKAPLVFVGFCYVSIAHTKGIYREDSLFYFSDIAV